MTQPLSSTALSELATSELEPAVAQPPKWLQTVFDVPRTEGTVNVDGCPIHYFEWGDKSKPGVIMVHGFLAHARCFAFIAPFLANDYHVVAMDMAGMGDSGWRSEYSMVQRANDLIQVAEHTGLMNKATKPFIVGHSFGGGMGTEAMNLAAERFAGLIIADLMIIRPSIIKAHPERFAPPGNRTPDKPNRVYPDYDTAKSRFVLSPPQSVEQPELFDYMAYHSLKAVEGGWQWKFDPRVFARPKDGESPWLTIGERVSKAPGRKAIVYGEKSLLFTPDSTDYMRELSADLKTPAIAMIGIPNARHHLMLDQPIAFATTLRSILGLWQIDA